MVGTADDAGTFSEKARRTGSMVVMGAVLGRFGWWESGANSFCRTGCKGLLYLLPVEDWKV